MAYKIDCSGAGPDADKCAQGTEMFRAKYSEEEWSIAAGRGQNGLMLTVAQGKQYPRLIPVTPWIDMAESVFAALEENRKNSVAH